jgi:Phage integrase, N-terminal SAM-like domain
MTGPGTAKFRGPAEYPSACEVTSVHRLLHCMSPSVARLPAELAEAVRDYMAASRAPETNRAYGRAWAAFEAWCAKRGLQALPASPETVATWLAALASGNGRRPLARASINQALSAVIRRHHLAGQALDRKHPLIAEMWRGISRTKARTETGIPNGGVCRESVARRDRGGTMNRALAYVACGIPAAIGIGFAARYAFVTSDTAVDGLARAFLYAMIAAGAFLGPVVRSAEKGSVASFMLACLPRAKGGEVTLTGIYARYQRWCDEQAPAVGAMDAAAFGEHFKALADKVRLGVDNRGGRVFVRDVRLVA